MHNTWYYLICGFFLVGFITEMIVDLLNYSHSTLHQDVNNKTTRYFKAVFKLSFSSSIITGILTFVILVSGLVGKLDDVIRVQTDNPYLQALLFFGVLGLTLGIVQLPFSIFRTFRIEEEYGFNRSTVKVFISDKVKGLVLSIVIGGGLLTFIRWIYEKNPDQFWLFAWITVTVFSILSAMFFASVLLPLFNKLVPMEKGELRTGIEELCRKLDFPLTKLYVMDGSKRSTKANAFFSGLGPRKAIVLYDTLVNNYTKEEILAVLAHEIGHYKLKHTFKTLVVSVIQTAVLFLLLGITLRSDAIALAMGGDQPSFQISIIAFAFLYSPVSMILSLLMNSLSRKHEFEADAYAKNHYNGEYLASALTKLHHDSLSNPNPHPVYVAFHYSHPTLAKRKERLSKTVS